MDLKVVLTGVLIMLKIRNPTILIVSEELQINFY